MKVISCVDIPIKTERLAEYLKMLILDLLDDGLKHKSNLQSSLETLIALFGLKDIHKAINSIYGKRGSLYIPTKGKSGMILRYLEYGGEGIRQTKIISTAVKQLNSKIGGNLHVF